MGTEDHIPVIVFGYDKGLGFGTRLRARRGAELYHALRARGRTPFIIVSAGRDPRVGEANGPTMAEEMADFLVDSCGVARGFICVAMRPVWGTRAELVEAIRVIQLHRECGYGIGEAYCVSNPLHVHLRIRLLAFALRRRLGFSWRWRFAGSMWGVPGWGLLARCRELGKFGVECLRVWFWRPTLA